MTFSSNFFHGHNAILSFVKSVHFEKNVSFLNLAWFSLLFTRSFVMQAWITEEVLEEFADGLKFTIYLYGKFMIYGRII